MRPFAHWASFSLISVPSLLPLLLTAFDFLWMILLAAWRLFGAFSSRRGTIRFALAFRNCSFRPRVPLWENVAPVRYLDDARELYTPNRFSSRRHAF